MWYPTECVPFSRGIDRSALHPAEVAAHRDRISVAKLAAASDSTFSRTFICSHRATPWLSGRLAGAYFCVLAAAIMPQVAVSQTFVPQGPAPATGSLILMNGNDTNGKGTSAGAVGSIVADPVDPNTLYVGTVSGGVWGTTNGGITWTALTDKQASLSIASLTADPTNSTGRTLLAGVGLISNGAIDNLTLFANRGGARTGLLYTQNGGSTWQSLGLAALQDQSVVGVVARGNTLLAATSSLCHRPRCRRPAQPTMDCIEA